MVLEDAQQAVAATNRMLAAVRAGDVASTELPDALEQTRVFIATGTAFQTTAAELIATREHHGDGGAELLGNYIRESHFPPDFAAEFVTVESQQARRFNMVHKTPRRSHRKGLSVTQLMQIFPTEEAARKWLESEIWPQGPYCGSFNVQSGIRHSTMTHRCRDFPNRPQFSVKSGTVMKGTKLEYRDWAITVYLLTTNPKGVSSMKLHRELEIAQKSAWQMMHRLRKSFATTGTVFGGPCEANETFIGGLEKNKQKDKKLSAGLGGIGKAIVVGIKYRDTGQVAATVVPDVLAKTLQGFVEGHTEPIAQAYTDDGRGYTGINRPHESVNHSAGECVLEQAHTNGIEPFWAMTERAHKGIYPKFSKKHLQRYVDEFSGRHNARNADTPVQRRGIVSGMVGKELRYGDMIADNGLASGART